MVSGTLVVKSYTCAKWGDTAFVYLAKISDFVELLLLSKNKQVALSYSYCVSHCFVVSCAERIMLILCLSLSCGYFVQQ